MSPHKIASASPPKSVGSFVLCGMSVTQHTPEQTAKRFAPYSHHCSRHVTKGERRRRRWRVPLAGRDPAGHTVVDKEEGWKHKDTKTPSLKVLMRKDFVPSC
jgi:hypothetical protein